MFVGPTFPGDECHELMWLQHDLWFKINGAWFDENGVAMGTCFFMFSCARKAIMFNVQQNPLFSPEIHRLPSITSFDYRVLQGAHGIIASFYRWCVQDIKPPVFCNNAKELRSYLLDAWKMYLRHEIVHITFGRLDIAEGLVKAVVFENTEQGYAAEDYIFQALEQRYGRDFYSDRERLSLSEIHSSEDEGYIYVMVSPALKTDLLKIGKTTRSPKIRAEEISVGTGVPMKFYVIYQVLVFDCHAVEREVHAQLSSQRYTLSREFFELPLNQAIEVIGAVAAKYPSNKSLQRTPFTGRR